MPGLLFLLWVNKSLGAHKALKFITVFALLGFLGLNIDKYTSIQNPLVTLSQKQIEFNKLANGTVSDAFNNTIPIPGSVTKINTLEPTLTSLITNSPTAFVNTLFRPFLWELNSPMMLLAGIENIIILLFIIICILFIKPLSQIPWEYVLFCLSFVIIQFLIIGSTTPIIGAIVRYKVPALPFLLIAFLLMLDKEKILKTIYRKKIST
jgi:hypothetical protein